MYLNQKIHIFFYFFLKKSLDIPIYMYYNIIKLRNKKKQEDKK
nr:MAG TPA: hypothetical protein [Caudoviricetes sp.]